MVTILLWEPAVRLVRKTEHLSLVRVFHDVLRKIPLMRCTINCYYNCYCQRRTKHTVILAAVSGPCRPGHEKT